MEDFTENSPRKPVSLQVSPRIKPENEHPNFQRIVDAVGRGTLDARYYLYSTAIKKKKDEFFKAFSKRVRYFNNVNLKIKKKL